MLLWRGLTASAAHSLCFCPLSVRLVVAPDIMWRVFIVFVYVLWDLASAANSTDIFGQLFDPYYTTDNVIFRAGGPCSVRWKPDSDTQRWKSFSLYFMTGPKYVSRFH
jgi:hypothetical protein